MKHGSNKTYMDIQEFAEFGYLQELNRRFLHPLGLALSVTKDTWSGKWVLGSIWDGRDDPEGFVFEGEALDMSKADRVAKENFIRRGFRINNLGFSNQPLPASSGSESEATE